MSISVKERLRSRTKLSMDEIRKLMDEAAQIIEEQEARIAYLEDVNTFKLSRESS